ncbi:hypothetical protein GJ496_012033 [Pomphorhynchus laevis]|nr:hypothetical protein GJ496_012033 [Pomphorhynchus laevis]
MNSDDELEFELRRRYEHKMGGLPRWAQQTASVAINKATETTSDKDDLKIHDDFENNAIECEDNYYLDPQTLNYQKVECRQMNHNKRVTSVEFNPRARILLSSSADISMKLWEVGNNKLTNLHTETFHSKVLPTQAAFITPDHDKVLILNGKNRSEDMMYFDLNTSQCRSQNLLSSVKYTKGGLRSMSVSPNGLYIALLAYENMIYLLNSQSLEVIRKYSLSAKTATSTCFTSDSQHLLAADVDANIYLFNFESNRCLQKFNDQGGFSGKTFISLSPSDKYLAVGSHTGIVNVYNCKRSSSDSKLFDFELIKYFDNVLCPVTFLTFNHSSEMFAFGSSYDWNALKIAHCSSMTVFKNIPKQFFKDEEKQKRIFKCAGFSPNSGFFVAGKDNGKLDVFRLNHYCQY